MAGVGIIRRSVHGFSRFFIRGSQVSVTRRYTKDQNEGALETTGQQEEPHTTSDTPLTSDKLGDNYTGAAQSAFPQQVCDTLMSPVNENDVEIKPDGLLYLPEIKYRRILNQSFGPGGWALMPRGDSLQFQSERDNSQLIVREYALFCLGRFVAQTVGEHTFYSNDSNMVYGKAMESAKSNALMRCCKDLGVASELWDPQFIIKWKEEFAVGVWCENARTKERKKMWRRKDRKPTDAFFYPWKEVA